MLKVISYSIYHSPNAYLGAVLLDRALQGIPVAIERRPICIPKTRGIKVADLVGGRETPAQSAYHREDCRRWATRYGIEINLLPPGAFEQRAEHWRRSSYEREELPARAYYASVGSGKEATLDRALFHAAWVSGRDVNEEAVVRDAIASSGLDPDRLLARAQQEVVGQKLRESLNAFDRDGCPGVPTWIFDGQRFWGKDRVDALVLAVKQALAGGVTIRPVTDSDCEWVSAVVRERWGAPIVVSRGAIHHPDQLPGFVAVVDDKRVGLLTFHVNDNECEVITIDALIEGIGIGGALLQQVTALARARGCRRIWLITTNENTRALRFYQKQGFVLAAIHRHALAASRQLKPSIPRVGRDGIPLRDEIEMERDL